MENGAGGGYGRRERKLWREEELSFEPWGGSRKKEEGGEEGEGEAPPTYESSLRR